MIHICMCLLVSGTPVTRTVFDDLMLLMILKPFQYNQGLVVCPEETDALRCCALTQIEWGKQGHLAERSTLLDYDPCNDELATATDEAPIFTDDAGSTLILAQYYLACAGVVYCCAVH